MMSHNGENETDMISIGSTIVKMIKKLNDMVLSRIRRKMRFLLDMLQHLEFIDVMLAIIAI
jgi:hypothetical protein